jgi:hypothetical protein
MRSRSRSGAGFSEVVRQASHPLTALAVFLAVCLSETGKAVENVRRGTSTVLKHVTDNIHALAPVLAGTKRFSVLPLASIFAA